MAVGIDRDGAFLQEAADGAFERFLAEAEHVADLLRARLVADARRVRTAEALEDARRVVLALLVCVAAERELDLSVGQYRRDAKLRRVTAP